MAKRPSAFHASKRVEDLSSFFLALLAITLLGFSIFIIPEEKPDAAGLQKCKKAGHPDRYCRIVNNFPVDRS